MSDQSPVNLFYPKAFKATKAVWHLRSKNNPKWNEEGPFLYKGMKGIPLECSHRIEQLKIIHGDPPEDLEWGYTLSDGKYLWVSFKWWMKGMLDWAKR